jgi:3-oxoacyl-[acyl-carrier protein] reductase
LRSFDERLSVNLPPALLAAQVLLPGMRKRGWGRIVNISRLTVLGFPDGGASIGRLPD